MSNPVTIPPVSEQYLANQPEAARLAVIIDVLLGVTGGSIAPTPPNALPTTIAAGVTYDTGVIPALGYNSFAASVQSTQAGSLTLQRYIDAAGTIAIGNAITQAITANVLATVAVNDGLPCASYNVTISNTSGSTANITKAAILAKK